MATVRRITVHGLRHTSATLFALCQCVQPHVVQQRLGHSNIGTTLDTYAPLHGATGTATVSMSCRACRPMRRSGSRLCSGSSNVYQSHQD